jgi:hypothetical protein
VSDFLSDLTERSLGATGTVRPQLASIFETPPLVNGGAFFPGPETSELSAIERRNQEPAERLSRLRSLWRTKTEPTPPFAAALSEPGITSRESAELPSASPQIRPRVDLPRKDQSVATSSEPRETAGTDRTEEGAGAIQRELSSASPQVRPRIDLPSNQPSIASPKERRRTAGAAKTDEEGRGALRPQSPSEHVASRSSATKSVFRDSGKNLPRERRVEKVVEIITPERDGHRELTQARNVRAVSQRPPSPRPLAPARQPKRPQVEPSINVTIGRVEVRATLPPEPSKTPRVSAPILSLDEYLRQRAGGRR